MCVRSWWANGPQTPFWLCFPFPVCVCVVEFSAGLETHARVRHQHFVSASVLWFAVFLLSTASTAFFNYVHLCPLRSTKRIKMPRQQTKLRKVRTLHLCFTIDFRWKYVKCRIQDTDTHLFHSDICSFSTSACLQFACLLLCSCVFFTCPSGPEVKPMHTALFLNHVLS